MVCAHAATKRAAVVTIVAATMVAVTAIAAATAIVVVTAIVAAAKPHAGTKAAKRMAPFIAWVKMTHAIIAPTVHTTTIVMSATEEITHE